MTDWERLRLRTINGSAVSADFSTSLPQLAPSPSQLTTDTHSGGAFSAGTYRWEDVEKIDGRPVAYIAHGSHGVWPNAGKHVYAQLLNLWQLVDVCDDRGALWDTKGHVVPIEFWNGPEYGHRIEHTGDQSWLEFTGKWGNVGDGCWYEPFIGICQLIVGPPGPNREFGIPPSVSKPSAVPEGRGARRCTCPLWTAGSASRS